MAMRLGELLLEKKMVSMEQLELALREQEQTGEMLGQIIIKLGFVSETDLLRVFCEQQGMRFAELKKLNIDREAVKRVPVKFARHYNIMPVSLVKNVLTVATSNPFDVWALDDLETNFGYRVEKLVAASADISGAIQKYYGLGADTIEQLLSEKSSEPVPEQMLGQREDVEDLEKAADDVSVVKLVNQILKQAVEKRSTDVHFEKSRKDVFVRSRIDGVLYPMNVGEKIKFLYPAIISRIKVMAGMDIIERRVPQDGRAKIAMGEKEYDLRVSVMPTLYGENVVLRILPTKVLFSFADLGVERREQSIIEKLLKIPHGVVFVVGPTGSGKSTTLYTFLKKLNGPGCKIVTIEDPIEYELPGITQTQVNPKINLTFAKVLRSMLRHDPDIIMVGEVRDLETAEITIQTALTGHLTFSTLHTNDAASGLTRLLDMGVEPFLISSSTEAFIAQRLVRVLCVECRERKDVDAASLDSSLGFEIPFSPEKERGGKFPVYHAKGCEACDLTGYSGRTGIYEILILNDEIRKLILRKADADEIKQKSVSLGMRTLLQSGFNKAFEGTTTIDEVIRVSQT